jgi:acyl-CoA thioester hydrolase
MAQLGHTWRGAAALVYSVQQGRRTAGYQGNNAVGGGEHMPRETSRIRVAFVDVDSSQRIHFTAMFRYFEVAEHALMRAIGQPYAQTLQDYRFPRVHLDCDLRAAVRFDDILHVVAEVDHVGRTSWSVRFTAYKQPGDTLAAEGHMTIVSLDAETERPTPIPTGLREALEGRVTPAAER